jgi:hypothetical protein
MSGIYSLKVLSILRINDRVTRKDQGDIVIRHRLKFYLDFGHNCD